jgi:hypothetical protein
MVEMYQKVMTSHMDDLNRDAITKLAATRAWWREAWKIIFAKGKTSVKGIYIKFTSGQRRH